MFAEISGAKGDVTQRNIWWSMEIAQLLVQSEELRNAIPDDATLVILPEGDDELCQFNLNMARQNRTAGTLVFVEIPASRGSINLQRVHSDPPQYFALA